MSGNFKKGETPDFGIELQQKLMDSSLPNNNQTTPSNPTPQSGKDLPTTPITWDDFQYKEFGNAPKITLNKLTLILVAPLSLAIHVVVSTKIMGIPALQYTFVTALVAFLLNYTAIIRRYELMPFLKDPYDSLLKKICVLGFVAIAWSFIFGWNGSSAIIFACYWQYVRGQRMEFYKMMFLAVIIGSLMMQQYGNKTVGMKILEFVPGIIFGYINSVLFTMRESSTYPIVHQFVFLLSMVLPMFFPAARLIVPNLLQWGFMLVTGVTMLLTLILMVYLMQHERVSVVVAVISGIMMICTTSYVHLFDFVGAGFIVVGIGFLLKKEYIEVRL